MGVVRTGSDRLRAYQDQKDATFKKGKFIPYVSLIDDGDRAHFRIVSDHNEEASTESGAPSTLVFGDFHRKQFVSARGKPFFKEVLCGMDWDEDNEVYTGECGQCTDDVPKRTKFMMWVYVFAYYHRNQSQDLKNPWEPVMISKEKVYKQKVEAFQVWQDGYYMQQFVDEKIDAYETLVDRDYMVRRYGVKKSNKVTRSLTESQPKDIAMVIDPESGEPILVLAATLPSLIDIATGEIETMDGHEVQPVFAEVTLDFPAEEIFGEEVEDIDDLPF